LIPNTIKKKTCSQSDIDREGLLLNLKGTSTPSTWVKPRVSLVVASALALSYTPSPFVEAVSLKLPVLTSNVSLKNTVINRCVCITMPG
jgi:hypothetical protein